MLKLSDVAEWRDYAQQIRRKGQRIGLVPTMGALHDGHVSLFREAKRSGDVVFATIFLNPRQFDDARDLTRYPRTPEHDLSVAMEAGVDCLIEPTLEAMWPDYPEATPTTVSVGGFAERLEGETRPGHFDGVTSVVAKLLAITGPCRAYFGEKDYQQLAIIRQMVRDIGFDVEVVGCPIVRDPKGLALSSRNVLLSSDDQIRARALSRSLELAQGEAASASVLRARMRATLEESGVDVVYVDVVDPITLVPSRDDESGERRALVAGLVAGVRLIDNAAVRTVGVTCS